MDLGVHLPLIRFGDKPLSLRRLEATVDPLRIAYLGPDRRSARRSPRGAKPVTT